MQSVVEVSEGLGAVEKLGSWLVRAFLISFCIFIYIKKIVFVNVFPIYVPYEKQPYQKQK